MALHDLDQRGSRYYHARGGAGRADKCLTQCQVLYTPLPDCLRVVFAPGILLL